MPTTNENNAVLTIDGVEYKIDELSTEAKGLVDVYNNWTQKENDARGELSILIAAKQTLSSQIVAKVRAENEAAETAEAAEAASAATVAANVTTDAGAEAAQ